jgi:DNA polymerase-3 subunit delta'
VPDGVAIKIDQVRKLKQQLVFPPLEAKVRVVILEDIQTMRREAANSLLKTLEEPAPNNLLILVADQAGDILPTIISRCQVVPFGPLDYEDLARVLMADNGIPKEDALVLASASEGSLGRAKIISEENLLAFRKEVVDALLTLKHGQTETVEQVYRLTERAAALKENIYEFLGLMRLWYRDLVRAVSGAPGSTAAYTVLTPSLEVARQRWNLAQLNEKIRRLDQAENQLLRNCNRTLVLETLFFDLI